jgi:23S rRNA G2445 N2-methylase RlmL
MSDRVASVLVKSRARGWTPGEDDVDALAEALARAPRESKRDLLRAAARAPEGLVAALARALPEARPEGRKLIVRALSDREGALVSRLIASCAEDDDARVRAETYGPLARDPGSEPLLLDRWAQATSDVERRALARALQELGTASALERLREASESEGSPSLTATVIGRARLVAERSALRAESRGHVRVDRAPTRQATLRVLCRRGLEPVVLEELRARGLGEGRRARPGQVEVPWSRPLEDAMAVRSALAFGFLLRIAHGDADASEIADALTTGEGLELLSTLSEGPARFRLEVVGAGHQRKLAWDVAERVARARAPVRNDPSESLWQVEVSFHDDVTELVLVPRASDARFAYRVATVPASSHPTVAAALALVGGARDDDVVWDPFVGAAAELVERARLGPYARLVGTDTSSEALRAARANLDAASVAGADLFLEDALTFQRVAPTLIVTNPPLGRRVARGEHVTLFERFARHAARVLAPAGRVVLVVPDAARLLPAFEREGLAVVRQSDVDMGRLLRQARAPRTGLRACERAGATAAHRVIPQRVRRVDSRSAPWRRRRPLRAPPPARLVPQSPPQ